MQTNRTSGDLHEKPSPEEGCFLLISYCFFCNQDIFKFLQDLYPDRLKDPVKVRLEKVLIQGQKVTVQVLQ